MNNNSKKNNKQEESKSKSWADIQDEEDLNIEKEKSVYNNEWQNNRNNVRSIYKTITIKKK